MSPPKGAVIILDIIPSARLPTTKTGVEISLKQNQEVCLWNLEQILEDQQYFPMVISYLSKQKEYVKTILSKAHTFHTAVLLALQICAKLSVDTTFLIHSSTEGFPCCS